VDDETSRGVTALIGRLEAAWNAADAAAFAAEFAEDADFVNIRGDHASGRRAIAEGHTHIWATLYAGSKVRYSLRQVRELAADVILAHLDAELQVPAGPLAGQTHALPSLVLVHADSGWKIASFHNTVRQK
jgi:uncharacterized protein (TIGR02246 family)